MTAFINSLDLIWSFLISCLDKLYTLFTSHPIFIAVFALWIISRIFNIFDFIKG